VTAVHHSAICVRDVDASLRFWRDGLGFEVLLDERFDGDWPTLLGATSRSLRAVFLGNPERAESGIVELVDFGDGEQADLDDAGRADVDDAVREPPPSSGPPRGFLLLSVLVDVETALARLGALGLGGEPRRTVVADVAMAVVVDPDGVPVELVDSGAAANLESLGVGQR
jgi:catechol 2,3-dioxygenase-like lactoylglutathione lyase family enzyme